MTELPRGTVTLLFTDIEGSTSLLHELGRERYVESLEAHRRLLRDAFGRFGGVEVEMQGDSFLFAFPSARDAVAGAAAATRSLAEYAWDGPAIRVRIGLHTGEPAVSGGLYAGLDVHRAARVMDSAHGGQILLSGRTTDLAVNELPPGTRTRALGSYLLKDFGAGEPLTQLSVDGLPSKFPPLRAERVPSRLTRRIPRPIRRHPRITATGAAAVGAAAIAALLLIGPTPTRFEANALAEADQHSGRVLGVVPVGDTPSALTAADGALWVANAGEATVSRVDPKQGRVVRTIALPGTPLGIVSGAGSIWVVNSDIAAAHSSVSRIDPRYARVTATIPLPSSILIGSGAEITWDGRDIWAVTQAGSAFRIDPSSNEVTARIPVGDDPTSLAASAGSIWVASRRAASISRIESPGAVTDTIKVGPVPSSIAAGAGALWVADSGENAVRRLDPRTGSVITTISVGRSPSSVAASGHDVWVGNAGDETVTRIDARTNRVTKTVDVGFPPASITIADGRVWIALQQATPAVTAAGGVARVLTSIPGAIDSVDPPLAYTTISWQIEYATCAKLVNYPDAFARRGFRLQPEIARSMPTVSDGGRTYTFTIRKGFRFSPPSNQEVTARTFKYSIERALAPGTKSFAVTFFPDIVGVRAYETGHASHISGVRALGDRLVIRLQEPAGDLPARLAMPFFCPVPIGTPVDFKGLAGVPSAGPYYVAAYSPNKDLVLRRNPNYRGPRPHRLAAIDVRQAPSEDAALAAVERNASDLILDAHHAVVVPSRYRSRFIRYRAPIVRYLALNTRGKVFSDPKVRRAAGLALNRAALASLDPSLKPTETLLPPGFPGAAARTAFRTEGNLAAARRTAGRLRARAVYLTCDSSSCIKQATLVARQLAPIGIKVVIKKLPVGVLFSAQWKRGVTWDITDAGWAMDYVDPADFLVPLATAAAIKPPPRGANVARFTDPSIEQMFARARALHGAARARAFANIEWTLRAKDVPYIAIANDTIPVLFSARTGCRVSSPVYGVDLAALCIRRRSP